MIQADYTKALERAHTVGLTICGKGWWKPDGSRVVGVSSASEDGRIHAVIVRDLALTCDCTAAQHGRYCSHRALVHEMLLEERFTRSDARIDKLERDLHRVAIQVVALTNSQDHGENSPLASTSRPFSIFK